MNKIEQLANKILECKKAYYIDDNPLISDDEFDLLEDELRALDPNHTVLKMTGVDIRDRNQWPISDLSERMGSLNKVKSFSEYIKWKNDLNKSSFSFNPKADGASIQLTYKSGILNSAITRGNGYQGEDITQNVLKMKNVKKTIDIQDDLILKGEIIIMIDDFKNYLSNSYSNPRNAASGISKSKDGKNTEHLTILYYDATLNGERIHITDLQDFFDNLQLKSIGIYNESEIEKYYNDAIDNREIFGFEIDGFVIKENAPPIYKNNNPVNQIALKFPAQSAVGKIKKILYKTTRTNRISIVAVLENPVNISGANISRISLGSWELMQEKQTFPGAIVEIIKANDVIPYITKVLDSSNSKQIFLQDIKNEFQNNNIYINGANLFVPENDNLNALYNSIMHIFNVLEIKNISGKSIEDIIDFYKLTEPQQIFDCDFDQIKKLNGWGDSKVQIIKQQFEDKCNIDIIQLIRMLSITNLGTNRIIEIINTFQIKTLDEIYNLSVKDFLKVSGIQENLGNHIYDSLQKRKKLAYSLLEKLTLKEGQKIISDELKNLSFSITGKTSMKRKDFENLIESKGGKITSINKANYLITNNDDSGSTKNKKAAELGVSIISENDFFQQFQISKT